jgi:TolB-like protein/Flp pilus assembly protein TadD
MEEGHGLLAELRRRKVVRAGVVYGAAAFALLEFADIAFPRIGLPDGAVDVVLWAGLLGLPVVLALAWGLELRAEPASGYAPGWLSVPALATAVVLVGLGLGAGRWWGARPPVPAAGVSERGASIAVLPFDDFQAGAGAGEGAGKGASYFSRGLTEDISAALSRFDDLTVLSPRVTAGADDARADPVRLGQDLGVRYVLSGSVRRAADAVRVSAELIDASTGAQLWSEHYDRDLTTAALFAIQDDIAQRVVATLADPTGVIAREAFRTTRRLPPESLEAYDCVLRAYRYFDVHTDAVHAEARDCLERVVVLEPGYSDAWAHLAYLYREEFLHRRNPRPEPLERALEAGKRAIELDGTNPMGHYALAMTYYSLRDFDAAYAAAERAIALNPNESTIQASLGTHIYYSGRWEEGLGVVRRAAALNPRHPTWLYGVLASDHYRRGDYTAALAEIKKNTRHDTMRRIILVATYGQLGRVQDARAALEDLLLHSPEFAADPMAEIRRIYLSDEITEDFAAGLRLAGLDLGRSSPARAP